MDEDELVAGHLQELRRGTVVLACLTTLARPHYGYALLETLAEAGFAVDGNTLYPLLRRLEKQGLLTSEWNTDEPRGPESMSSRGTSSPPVASTTCRACTPKVRPGRLAHSTPSTGPSGAASRSST